MKIQKLVTTTITLAFLVMSILASTAKATIDPGILHIEGSSTLLPVSLGAENDFEDWVNTTHSIELDVQPAGGGSGAGFSRLAAGTIDIGASSRLPKSSEWTNPALSSMNIWAIGIDSIAIIVHNATGPYPGCSVNNLTFQQVSDIFCGVINYWDELNSSLPHQAIKRAIRVLDSGTHDCFLTYFLTPFNRTNSNLAPDCVQYENNIQIYNLLASDLGQWYIAYIGLGFIHLGSIKPLWLYNSALATYVQPTKEHVLDGSYPPFRWLWYLTNGTLSLEQHVWISFVKSNQSYIEAEGYITMYRADFTGTAPSGDPQAPIHPPLPDNKVDFYDMVYFADAYIAYQTSGALNAYADFNADGAVNYNDVVGFVLGYQYYWASE